ncbi:brain-specific angiogenesis inhibitor 1-associated protein 2-like isoform X1 [Stegostoma tigrinum]|uniref:brain-specific angiogenesis inhibitor 1-associated protein 2-like isoform X1 n=2 Tax=Stegostoma tigrinum TaxID=3053191 RepID=UPI002870A478|nr:brain-specific angiogenesis inhibitor 1-associated protein 2-like isoform X1 [Stegostoma tigrinum]
MSRTDEVHRMTESVYKTIMDQFNPSLKNFIAMGKSYEKALSSHMGAEKIWIKKARTGMTFAAKGYFEALVKMGELASDSHASKEMGDVLFQMAEVHRQIQIQLEEMLKVFHNDLLMQLEQKVELDAKYLTATLKKYQAEHKARLESLEKCHAELKKLRRKSQGSKNPQKYGDKEMQFVETISKKQSDLDSYTGNGYKTALSEERRRYCFLVEKQCAVAKNNMVYHSRGKDMITQKLPSWQQACSDPSKIPERAMSLVQQMSSGNGGTLISEPVAPSKSGLVISDPIPGAKPLPVPPELAPFVGGGGLGQGSRMMGQDIPSVPNGDLANANSADYQQPGQPDAKPKPPTPPQLPKQQSDVYSNTLPTRKAMPLKASPLSAETRTLPRSSSMAAGLEKNGRTKVQAIFSHQAKDNNTLLSFNEGDVITLLVPEAKDGWHYGENEKTRLRGWFPFSYTRVLQGGLLHNLNHLKSCSTGNLLQKEDLSIPPPDYNSTLKMTSHPLSSSSTFKPRPYSVAVPGFSQGPKVDNSRLSLKEAVANVKLKPTKTNDRSASKVN